MKIEEFILKLNRQIDEWEYYEKRFPDKETKWNRIRSRINKLTNELKDSHNKDKNKFGGLAK